MNKLKTLAVGGLIALATLAGCGKGSYEPQYLEGKVTKETGTIVGSNDFLLGNETSTFGNIGNTAYNLEVETSKGRYTLNVYEQTFGKTLGRLAEEIEVGDRIKFQTNYDNISQFSTNKKGSVPTDAIEVLKK